jgi:hypothetical protein
MARIRSTQARIDRYLVLESEGHGNCDLYLPYVNKDRIELQVMADECGMDVEALLSVSRLYFESRAVPVFDVESVAA